MISKVRIKYLRSLQLKKYRLEHRSFVIENPKVIYELVKSQSPYIKSIIGTYDALDGLPLSDHRVEEILPRDCSKITSLRTAPELFAECRFLSDSLPAQVSSALYLDDLQDPGNVGTMIRTADWFGIDLVVCSRNTVDIYNPKLVQACMGSNFSIPLVQLDWSELSSVFSQLRTAGADMDGDDFTNVDLHYSVLIIGNEGRGLSPKLLEECDQIVSIPRHSTRTTESLNAAVSAGILMSKMTHLN